MEDNYNEKIDLYLDGELSAEDQAAFEKSMEQDPQLEEEIRQNLLLREIVETGYQEKMRSDIRTWRSQTSQSDTQKLTNMRKLGYRLAAAASVVIILTATIFTGIVPQYSNSRIAARYYEPDEDLGAIRGNNDADILRQAFENYEQGNFTGAIPGFQRYPNNDKALYGLGLSFYQIEDYENAVETFKTLIERDNIEYTERAEFYLLLSYLHTDQTGPEFQELLNKMIEEGGYYAGQAEGVKKKLDSFWRSLR
jgi:TolA-binding protein